MITDPTEKPKVTTRGIKSIQSETIVRASWDIDIHSIKGSDYRNWN